MTDDVRVSSLNLVTLCKSLLLSCCGFQEELKKNASANGPKPNTRKSRVSCVEGRRFDIKAP